MEALGALDEATAALGLARALNKSEQIEKTLIAIQRDLYQLMAEVAATPENAARFRALDPSRLEWLEAQVDAISSEIQIPDEFILPGDSLESAVFALARTVIRRAERRLVELVATKQVENLNLIAYLNRLSSLCFILELYASQNEGRESPTLAKVE